MCWIGLGAATMEMIYCSIMFTGFSSFFDNPAVKASMEVFSFVLPLSSAENFLMAQSVNVPTTLDAKPRPN